MTKDLRIEFKVKNAILYRALQEFALHHNLDGYGEKDLNFAEISRYIGMSYDSLIGFLTLRVNPWAVVGARAKERTYRLRVQAVRLRDALDLSAGEIFPFALYKADIPRDYAVEVSSIQMISFAEARRQKVLPPPEECEMEDPQNYGMLYEAIKRLSPREEKIIRMRFGFDGEEEHSYGEIGEKFAVSKARIQQIERKALRHLRHPAHKLREL